MKCFSIVLLLYMSFFPISYIFHWVHLWSQHSLIALNMAMIFQANYEHTPEKNRELRNGEKQTRTIQEMMDLFVKLIFSEEKTDISCNIRVHSDLFFILVTYLIWQWARGNPLKSNFPPTTGCFII